MENGGHGRHLELAVGPVGQVLEPEYGVVTIHGPLGAARVASEPINKNGHAIQTIAQHVGHKPIFYDISQSKLQDMCIYTLVVTLYFLLSMQG